MSERWTTFAFEAANFLVLAAALGWFFFRPVRAALERRRSEIEAEQRAAASAREQAERERQDARGLRGARDAELAALRERLAREAEAEKEALVASGRAEIERERARAGRELASQRRAQAGVLARDAVGAAQEVVRNLLGLLKGPELDALLLEAACRSLEGLRAQGDLGPLVIESAAPLAPAERERVLRAARAEEVSVRLDPSLIAGLRVLTRRGLVDTSVAGLSAQAKRLLAARIEAESPPNE